MDEIIAEIRRHHRLRCFAMDQRKSLDLRLGSMLRMQLGWRKDLPDAQRKFIAAQAQDLMDAEEPAQFQNAIVGTRLAREPFEAMERSAEKEMGKLAKALGVWEDFGGAIRGFGAVSLAIIIAEAGDLSNYASDAKLWKRMGLAPGQNRVPPGLSREDRAAAWIANAYNPRRRSRMWNIGDSLIKGNRDLIKGNRDGKYRTLYLMRKEYEHARDPEMSKMHAHRRAQKYMEKRLLRDLWRAWRRARKSVAERPAAFLPAASSITTEANRTLPDRASARLPPL